MSHNTSLTLNVKFLSVIPLANVNVFYCNSLLQGRMLGLMQLQALETLKSISNAEGS